MGLSPFRGCSTNYGKPAPAPNPDSSRWQLLSVKQFDNAHVVIVRYLDCTNYEGVKVMVIRGRWTGLRRALDPHFSDDVGSPVARFRPDDDGIRMAEDLASGLAP